ncbi:unnamed protein product [Rotaria socialis]|uniref:Glutamate dehydrogenase n=2 Tax=Rotaria socialis TaxID=392032 RepID=A0A818PUG5_9BILA|nr:unnamed protein product [Rotaria socialis]
MPGDYVDRVIERLRLKNSDEKEFLEVAEEVLKNLRPVIQKHPEYEKMALLERFTEPERVIIFRVPWEDDQGQIHVNRGYRVQFNGAIGPYKGGLRFHPTVYLGIIKFLGFEQILKNSLTGLPIGGGKGGSDFDPQGKSDSEVEVLRFCQSFMSELYRHIGPDIDIPAGDIGVGGREIGYLYGQYRRIRGAFENGVLTGKGIAYGGSHIRSEATGYGAMYYAEAVLKEKGDSLNGKVIVLSGYGNVAWGVCLKARDFGSKVISISGRDGYIHDPEGINTDEKIDFLLRIRGENNVKLEDYAKKFGVKFYPKEKPWNLKGDIAFPSATENEIDLEEAKTLTANGVKYVFEGANFPTTPDAIEYFKKNGVILGPAIAANAGGVAVSELEMAQNSTRLLWTKEKVDSKLKEIMVNIHKKTKEASEKYGLGYDLVAGANIAGFEKVAEAMIAQGTY